MSVEDYTLSKKKISQTYFFHTSSHPSKLHTHDKSPQVAIPPDTRRFLFLHGKRVANPGTRHSGSKHSLNQP